jgi:uncharacterized membrane protein
VLLLIAFQLLVGGLHELSEGKILPASRTEMALVGPLIKNELLLFTLTLALAVGWMLLGAGRAATAPGAEATGPESRLARAAAGRDLAWRRGLGMLGLLVVGLLAASFVTRSQIPGPEPAAALAPEGENVAFDAGALADGHMHFFEAKLASGSVRFFAIQVGTEVRTCLDACEICGPKGYFMQGSAAVCRNCTSPIALSSLGRGGGCNPVPLPSHRDGARVVVSAADLESAKTKGEGH